MLLQLYQTHTIDLSFVIEFFKSVFQSLEKEVGMSRLKDESRPEPDTLSTCSTNIKSCTVVGMSYNSTIPRRWGLNWTEKNNLYFGELTTLGLCVELSGSRRHRKSLYPWHCASGTDIAPGEVEGCERK